MDILSKGVREYLLEMILSSAPFQSFNRPELVEVEERRGDLLLRAVNSFDELPESEQPKLEVKRDLLIEGARALRRARTEVEIAAGLKHPLVPYLEFKATCAAKAAARHTQTINSSVEGN